MLLLIRLVDVFVEATTPTAHTTSTTTLSSASASIVEFVVSSIAAHEVSIVLILGVAHRLLMLHFVLDEVDKLLHLVDVLLFIFVVQVVFRLPELYSKSLCSKSKRVRRVVHLDALLSLADFLVADVSYFEGYEYLSVDSLFLVPDFNRNDFTGLLHLFLELALSHILGNESDKDVGLECLLHLLTNWGSMGSLMAILAA